jgi:hypothetical protein
MVIAQAQAVVDVAQQHQRQHQRKAQPLPGGQDVDAPLVERDGPALDLRAEQPGAELLFECGKQDV